MGSGWLGSSLRVSVVVVVGGGVDTVVWLVDAAEQRVWQH